jgi:hypothetical protein
MTGNLGRNVHERAVERGVTVGGGRRLSVLGRCWLRRGSDDARSKGRRRAPKCPLRKGRQAAARFPYGPPRPSAGGVLRAGTAAEGTSKTTDRGVEVILIIGDVVALAILGGIGYVRCGRAQIAQDGLLPTPGIEITQTRPCPRPERSGRR